MMTKAPDRSSLTPDAHLLKCAVQAAEFHVQLARKRALLATCHWIEAEGTVGELDALKRMNQAEDRLNDARGLHGRVIGGLATGHEIVALLRRSRGVLGSTP